MTYATREMALANHIHKDIDHMASAYSPEEDFTEEIHSPTDSSEDSVEVKVEAISIRNKRKCVEPRRVQDGPLKKRMCLQNTQPFRPWSESGDMPFLPETVYDGRAKFNKVEPCSGYFRPPSPIRRSPSPQLEPVELVKKKKSVICDPEVHVIKVERDVEESSESEVLRVPIHPQFQHMGSVDGDSMMRSSAEAFPRLQQSRKEQRNYKNMTRERRIEANARERTRVHTISAAFDTLRRSIPAYSSAQKLSKLSVLRVACSYIMTLSNMLDEDESEVEHGVEQVTKTIQREGKLRKKKDEVD